jgi:hypothetical protein
MYVILTSKPGQFRTELVDGLQACESYDYLFYGQKKARFVIAQLDRPVAVRVIDETPPVVVNNVPSKFLESFDTIEAARHELEHLVSFGHMDTRLESVP